MQIENIIHYFIIGSRLKTKQKMTDKTSTLLVEDLEDCLKRIKSNDENILKDIKTIIENAKKMLYDDFISENATPKMLLMSHLENVGLNKIKKNVMDGKYD